MNMSTKIINTGLLSFGMSGKVFHAPFIEHNGNFKLRAVLERSSKTAHQYYTDIISYNSLEEILADQDIDLIVVNTPNNLHYEHAKSALLSGKHVLVEKPAAITVKQLEDLYALAEKQGLHFMVYQNRRWDSDFNSVKTVLESKKLGDLVEAHFRFDRYKLDLGSKAFKETSDTPGSGLHYDLGPHLLDQVISLFGKPLQSHRVTSAHRPGSKVTDYFSYQLLYPNQLTVYVTGSLMVLRPQAAYVFHGTKGTYIKERSDVQEPQLVGGMNPSDPKYGIDAPELAGELTVMDADNKILTLTTPAEKGDYNELFNAVFQTIVNNVQFPIKKEELIWQIKLLEN